MTPLPDRLARPGIAALALWAALAATPAPAAIADPDPLEGLEPIALAELGEARGGMVINGIPINFALKMRTMVEDATPFGLETVFTITDQGSLGSGTTSVLGGANGTTMTPTSSGFALALPSGTTIVHEAMNGQIRTYLGNVLDGVTLNQHVDLDVELPGMSAATQSWASSNLASRASLDAMLSGLRR
jgi:hypothetical protein